MKNYISHIKRLLSVVIIYNFLFSCSEEVINLPNKEVSNAQKADEIKFLLAKRNNKKIIVETTDDPVFLLLHGETLIHKSSVEILEEITDLDNIDQVIANIKSENKNNTISRKSSFGAPIEPSTKLWKDGVIYLAIDKNSFDNTERISNIYQAVSKWSNRTKLKFKIVSLDSYNPKTIVKNAKSGCNSSSGDLSPRDGTVNLSSTCDLISTIHEIGHVIGLIHEHQRPKSRVNLTGFYTEKEYKFIRDNVGKVGLDGKKIVASIKNNLSVIDVIDDDLSFDYKSVMIYGSYPRNNLTLSKFLKDNNLPFYRDYYGNLVPRPLGGITHEDRQKVLAAYPFLENY